MDNGQKVFVGLCVLLALGSCRLQNEGVHRLVQEKSDLQYQLDLEKQQNSHELDMLRREVQNMKEKQELLKELEELKMRLKEPDCSQLDPDFGQDP